MGFMDRLISFLDFDNVPVFIRANFLFSSISRQLVIAGEQLQLVYRIFAIN